MTAAADMRFKVPVMLGAPIVLFAESVARNSRHVLYLDATVSLRDGTMLATAAGTFVSNGALVNQE